MTGDNKAELRVGIFAIKNDVVDTALEHFSREDVQVSYVQMAPMALYNYVLYDRPELVKSDGQAVVVLNIGAEITDLVVCTRSLVWQRCILIGGNTFTRAIADTFRLNFEKAEKLKRTAPVSKYARQIFQSMRPVFTDLASEVQRSLGFYKSSNPNITISKIIGLGGGTKLRGLLKYIQQTLQIPVERPDTFKRLAVGSGVSAAKFGENVCDFGVVYGLGLQGLGLGVIESNLLPRSIARSMAWAGKGRWFIGAACMLLVVSCMALGRTFWDMARYGGNADVRGKNSSVLSEAGQAGQNTRDAEEKISVHESAIAKEFEPFEYREMMPFLYETIISALPNAKNNPTQASLYSAFDRGDVAGVTAVPRKARKQLFITNMSANFTNDLLMARFGGASLWRSRRGIPDIEYEEDEEYYDEMSEEEYELMMRIGEEYDRYNPLTMGLDGEGQELEKKAGFVVSISGYSPYEDIESLIDPSGVEGEQERWGFVTRLLHLDDFVDGNSPFELYEKTNPLHFNLEVREVDILASAIMPIGIGEYSYRHVEGIRPSLSRRDRWILVDPLTKELISKVAAQDENGNPVYVRGKPAYEDNDHWFVLNVKFVWRDAPEIAGAEEYVDTGLPVEPIGDATSEVDSGGSASPPSSSSTRRSRDIIIEFE